MHLTWLGLLATSVSLTGLIEIKPPFTQQPQWLSVKGCDSFRKKNYMGNMSFTKIKVTDFHCNFLFIRRQGILYLYSLTLDCCREIKFCYRGQMQCTTDALPVSGRAGVEDVLFGREQRQAVGIKVDRSRAHDGKSFQTTPAASLHRSSFQGFQFSESDFLQENCRGQKVRIFHGRENCSEGMQAHAMWALVPNWGRCVQALRTHSVEDTATAHWSLCSGVE